MQSIRVRLTVLFVCVVTLALGGFTWYAHGHLSSALEQGFVARQQEALLRLSTTLPGVLWNYDKALAERVLQAELAAEDLVSVRVWDSEGQLFVQQHPRAPSATPLVPLKAPLFLPKENQDMPLGRVELQFSHARIDATLAAELRRRVQEIVLLDVALIAVLGWSLGLVFRPMAQLRDALHTLATQDGDEARELPETSHNEFGEVVHNFNLTQRKLRQVILRRTQAEEAARAATSQAQSAYHDLQATQASLVQAEKMASLGGMVAGVAHEINTPVGIVLTSASSLAQATQQLQRSMDGAGARKSEVQQFLGLAAESARLIENNAERAAHLIQSFKQVAVDQTSDQRRSFELGTYIEELVTSLKPSLRRAQVTVQVCCPQPVQMDSYPGLLAQVLTNLCMNALTHAFAPQQAGRIEIRVTPLGAAVEIAVLDNGCGIPDAYLGKIFEPFFTTRRGQGGTGLGLNIVFNIVTKQLAGMVVARNNPEQGAGFYLHLPVYTPTGQGV